MTAFSPIKFGRKLDGRTPGSTLPIAAMRATLIRFTTVGARLCFGSGSDRSLLAILSPRQPAHERPVIYRENARRCLFNRAFGSMSWGAGATLLLCGPGLDPAPRQAVHDRRPRREIAVGRRRQDRLRRARQGPGADRRSRQSRKPQDRRHPAAEEFGGRPAGQSRHRSDRHRSRWSRIPSMSSRTATR